MTHDPTTDKLPKDYITGCFRLLGTVVRCQPKDTLPDDISTLRNSALSEIILSIQDSVLPHLAYLIQLSFAAAICLFTTDLLTYRSLKYLIVPAQTDWAIRNLYFVTMIAVGFASIVVVCKSVGAGLYIALMGNMAGCLFF